MKLGGFYHEGIGVTVQLVTGLDLLVTELQQRVVILGMIRMITVLR